MTRALPFKVKMSTCPWLRDLGSAIAVLGLVFASSFCAIEPAKADVVINLTFDLAYRASAAGSELITYPGITQEMKLSGAKSLTITQDGVTGTIDLGSHYVRTTVDVVNSFHRVTSYRIVDGAIVITTIDKTYTMTTIVKVVGNRCEASKKTKLRPGYKYFEIGAGTNTAKDIEFSIQNVRCAIHST